MPEVRHVFYYGHSYFFYLCPRCFGGSMAFERDRDYLYPALKCVLCGAVIICRPEKKFRKKPMRVNKIRIFKAKSVLEEVGKQIINDHKWHFSANVAKLKVQKST